jgi:hypothetical protein
MDEIAGALVQALADAARQRQAQRQATLGANRTTVPGSPERAKMIRPTASQQQAVRSAQMRPNPVAAKPPPGPEGSDDWRLDELGPDPMQLDATHPAAVHARHLRGLLSGFGERHHLLGALVVLEVLRPPLALRPFDER